MEQRKEFLIDIFDSGHVQFTNTTVAKWRLVGGKTIRCIEIREGERITSEPELPVPGKTYTNPCGESRRIDKIQIVHDTVEIVYNGGFCCSIEMWNAWLVKKPKLKKMLKAEIWITKNNNSDYEMIWRREDYAKAHAERQGHTLIHLTGSTEVEVNEDENK